MHIKTILSSFFLVTLVLWACEEDKTDTNTNFQSTAQITGPDLGQCICCGGYLIEIGDSTYNFDTIPSASNIDLTTATFPLNVKLNWSYDKKCGNNQYIEILRIEKE